MSGSTPGQIRCPTCHRSTPALDFCVRCRSPIPPAARARPRGLDRDELQARIRARRSGQPYRRGTTAADYAAPTPLVAAERTPTPAEPWTDDAWGEFDDAGRRSDEAQAAGSWDDQPNRWEPDERLDPPRQPPTYVDDPTVRGPAYGPPGDAEYGEQPGWEPLPYDQSADQTAQSDVRYRVRTEYEDRHRRSSGGPFLIIAFIGLGALALVGGAMLAGMFGRDDDGAAAVPSPAATVPGVVATPEPTPVATVAATPAASPDASASPRFSFPDGFTAEAEPCIGEPVSPGVCTASGEVVSSSNGSVWILVRFENIKGGDLIGARGVGPDGGPIGDASWEAGGPGSGWAYFAFALGGLPEGDYEVTVTRNTQPAAITEFRVEN